VQMASLYSEVKVIELLENRGKGGAVKVGLNNCDNQIVLILDADLTGLTEKHIKSLLEPVVNGSVMMSTGIFEKGRAITDLAQKVAPFLSGQRALKRELLESLSELDLARFGIEIALHQFVENNKIKTALVQLPNLSHVMKEEKLGFWKGFFARVQMYWEIIRYVARSDNGEK